MNIFRRFEVFSVKCVFAVTLSFATFSLRAGTVYWLDNSVETSGDGLSRETAFKTWNEAWDVLATLSVSAKAELNVVASSSPYYVTSAPPALAGKNAICSIRGVNADGTAVSSPASVVVDGSDLYQIAPLGDNVSYLVVSGITFRNALGNGTPQIHSPKGGALLATATDCKYNVISNCVFTGCSGGPACCIVGMGNKVIDSAFHSNTGSGMSGLALYRNDKTGSAINSVIRCNFEYNGGDEVACYALYCLSATEVRDCVFKGNISSSKACAMYLDGKSSGLINVSKCDFLCNTNMLVSGDNADITCVSYTTFSDCTFKSNKVSQTRAACISQYSSNVPIKIMNCTFEENNSSLFYNWGDGSFLYVSNCVARANLKSLFLERALGDKRRGMIELYDCLFESNKCASIVENLDVTGKNNLMNETNVVKRCIFRDNIFSNSRGGYQAGRVMFDSCIVTGNTNSHPLFVIYGPFGMTNCLFSFNSVSGTGVSGDGSSILSLGGDSLWIDSVVNCTFVSNTSVRATLGIYYKTADDTVSNCIFSGNKWEHTQFQMNLMFVNSFADFNLSSYDSSNIGGVGADPGFTDVSARDFTLTKKSICRNAGVNIHWTQDGTADGALRPEIYDLVGNPRVCTLDSPAKVDLGCYEFIRTEFPLVIIVK